MSGRPRSGGGAMGGDGDRRRSALPRRLDEVLTPALDRLATSDQARAYSAWARAVGEQVAAGTRPKAFGRGRLTVECASSVWANELTYLSPQILRRMDEVMPGHPVKRFRFVVGRVPAGGDAGAGVPSGENDAVAARSGQEKDPAAAKRKRRSDVPAPGAYGAARAEAEGVRDERLRKAIQAALRRSSGESPAAPGGDPGPG